MGPKYCGGGGLQPQSPVGSAAYAMTLKKVRVCFSDFLSVHLVAMSVYGEILSQFAHAQ